MITIIVPSFPYLNENEINYIYYNQVRYEGPPSAVYG